MKTVHKVLLVAAPHRCNVYQMDVMSTFLNGKLKEEVYVQKPSGFEVQGQEDTVYRLKKLFMG